MVFRGPLRSKVWQGFSMNAFGTRIVVALQNANDHTIIRVCGVSGKKLSGIGLSHHKLDAVAMSGAGDYYFMACGYPDAR